MYQLAKLSFPKFARLIGSGRALTILPVGVVEEHGAHLPLGLDTFAAEVYAEAAAPHLEEAGYTVLLAPPIAYGVARQALDFPGTLTLGPGTLRATVIDIGRSLSRHGVKRLAIVNGHRDREHMLALEQAASTLAAEENLETMCVGFTTDPAVTHACHREGLQGLSRSRRPDREGHGGEWETSLALYRFPDLVDTDVMRELEPNFDYDVEAFRQESRDYWTLSQGKGYFGSPLSGSAETGRRVVEIRGRNIARVILNALGSAPENPR